MSTVKLGYTQEELEEALEEFWAKDKKIKLTDGEYTQEEIEQSQIDFWDNGVKLQSAKYRTPHAPSDDIPIPSGIDLRWISRAIRKVLDEPSDTPMLLNYGSNLQNKVELESVPNSSFVHGVKIASSVTLEQDNDGHFTQAELEQAQENFWK